MRAIHFQGCESPDEFVSARRAVELLTYFEGLLLGFGKEGE